MNPVIVDLGCGDRKIRHSVGVDCVHLSGVDKVHDLNVFPYPFDDDSVDRVVMNNIIEHLDDTIAVLGEVYRMLRPGGVCHIEVVYWNHKYTWSDPQHKHAFTELSWEFFTGKRKQYYTSYAFELLSFEWQYDYHLKNIPKFIKRFLGKFLCNVIAGMVVDLKKPYTEEGKKMEENMTCEYCMESETMHLNPKSDRMLCKSHRVDVTRNQRRCKDFRRRI